MTDNNTIKPNATSPQLDQCFGLLSSSRDEDKFVGLMLLPKILDPADTVAVERAFDAVPWKFIHRLLISKEGSADLPASTMQLVAVNITASFCAFPSLISKGQVISLLKPMAELLSEQAASEVSAIIIEIFTRVAAEPTTAHELSNPEILSKVAAVAASAEDPNKSTAMSLLLLCFQKESSVKDEMVLAVMPAFAETFESCNGAYKFDVLKMAVELLLGWQPTNPSAMAALPWVAQIHNGLKELLRNKLNASQRDLALVLSSIMLRVFGFQWIFTSAITKPPNTQSPQPISNDQFAAILIHIDCAEIRVLLDDLPETDVLENIGRAEHMLPTCYEIVECAVQFLIEKAEKEGEEEEEEVLPAAVLRSVREALQATFLAIGTFLTDRLARYRNTGDFRTIDNVVTAFSIRCLSTYLAEETSLPPQQISSVLPVLVLAAERRLTSVDVHPMVYLTPAFTTITADEEMVESFISCGGCDAVISYFIGEEQSTDVLKVALLGVLLNVVVAEAKVVREGSGFVKLLGRVEGLMGENPILSANISTLSVFILRGLSDPQIKSLDTKLVTSLLSSVITFIITARGWERSAPETWAEVSELWFLCTAATPDCLRLLPEARKGLDPLFREKLAKLLDTPTLSQDERKALSQVIDALIPGK